MRIRHILATNANLTQTCRVWMLLALDVVYNRFSLLPTDLQKFYQEQLGDKAMANFQVIAFCTCIFCNCRWVFGLVN